MQDWLSARAAATPDQMGLVFEDRQFSFAEIDILTSQTCYWLIQNSLHYVRQSMPIMLLRETSVESVIIIHSLARLQKILSPMNLRLIPEELNWQLNHSNSNVVLQSIETEDEVRQFTSHAGKLVNLNFSLDSLQSLPDADKNLPFEYADMGVNLESTQAIVFTSGTSGKPKGVEITFGNHFYSAMASAYRLGLNPNDRWLSVLPLYHVGGLAVIFRSTLYGITTVLHDRFDIDRIQYSFDHHNITIISLVPTMLYRMIEAGVRWPDSLRLILLGGAAASPELLQQAFDMGLPIAPTYGLTEAASQVATMRPDDARKKPGSVGKPLLFTSVRIVDENGDDVPAGEYGEVLVKGPTVMNGYYRNDEANAKTLRDGWLHTGDIGYLDHDGDLFLVQRRSDLIVSGGENVYPAEVEAVLRAHPAVKDVSVVGVDSIEWGQQVAAAVVLEACANLSRDDLIAYCREHLAGYKRPRRVLFVEALPQTASGKVQRSEVQKLFTGDSS